MRDVSPLRVLSLSLVSEMQPASRMKGAMKIQAVCLSSYIGQGEYIAHCGNFAIGRVGGLRVLPGPIRILLKRNCFHKLFCPTGRRNNKNSESKILF